MHEIKVDEQRCIGCVRCIDAPPSNVYKIHNKTSAPVDPEKCIGCESCCEVCGAGDYHRH